MRRLEHHGRADPSVEASRVVDLEATTGVVDRFAEVRVRNARRGEAARGVTGAARTGLVEVVVEVRVARLVEGDEVPLHQGVIAADVELHELTGLVRGLETEAVDAVLLH